MSYTPKLIRHAPSPLRLNPESGLLAVPDVLLHLGAWLSYITYSRGKITVLDRAGLEASSCECYGIVRAHFERLLP